MEAYSYYEYYEFDNAKFFTLVLMPDKKGKFPVVVTRSPYVSSLKEKSEDDLVCEFKKSNIMWAENNYVLIVQHCRGQGKSTGDFVPYIHEREDGLKLIDWVRNQSFYDGTIFLAGSSYTASLHYSTAPFGDDVKGAVFDVQDSERYRLWYRNGQMRRGHANWHFSLYKDKSNLNKTHTMDSFSIMPVSGLSEKVLGERAEDFEQMLSAPNKDNPFWETRFGGSEARNATNQADIPILLTTGYNDFYVGGIFKMWEEMSCETKRKSALIVSPYNHGQSYDANKGLCFLKGAVSEKFGADYRIKWFNSILNKEKTFVETGKITYYRTFENKWESDFAKGDTKEMVLSFSDGEKTFAYDPSDPPSFVGEGIMMNPAGERCDVITIYTEPFSDDVFVKGRMKMSLAVSSDCEDTSFYIMTAICTEKGDYSLRHDITSILFQKDAYEKNEETVLEFEFDEYAFAIKKGQRLRIDISSTDKNTYVCHSNKKGDYSTIKSCKTAQNKVFLQKSKLILPVEKK